MHEQTKTTRVALKMLFTARTIEVWTTSALQILNRAFCEARNPQPARRFH
jgi:hypothetical protein